MKKIAKSKVKKEVKPVVKGYKVFNKDFACVANGNKIQYQENKEFKIEGVLSICSWGIHFCTKAQDCFKYYSFDPENIVCEVEARGKVLDHSEDSKHCTDILFVGRRLSWHEVLEKANSGSNNTGHSNSGNWNSGYRNSGYSNSGNRNSGNWNSGDSNSGDSNSGYSNSGNWNSGDSNSGDSNSGYSNSGNWNSGDRNSGNRNSGNRNSGNWNSGYRNSGDSNSGYRNSGAFCIDNDPVLFLFDKPTKIRVREWENHKACQIMNGIDPTIWVPASMMTDEEKASHPKWETTEGYLKTISMKEAWANLWGNLDEKSKKVFSDLENFDSDKFFQITGIRI